MAGNAEEGEDLVSRFVDDAGGADEDDMDKVGEIGKWCWKLRR